MYLIAGSETGEKVYKQKWDDVWFLTKPEEFQYTHLPLSNNNVEVETQLLSKPFLTLEAWVKQVCKAVYMYKAFIFQYNMDLIAIYI